MKKYSFILLLAVPLIMVSCRNRTDKKADSNQTMDKNTMVLTNTVNDNDGAFIKKALSTGMMEIELGKYAQQNAQNQRVKNFGAMMERDHSQASADLKKLAMSKNYTVSDSIADEKAVNDLRGKKGVDFDQDYIKQMVDDHEKVIDDFKKMAEKGRDEDLKQFVIKILPTLQIHLDSAQNISKALK